jgi:hypothetical protein
LSAPTPTLSLPLSRCSVGPTCRRHFFSARTRSFSLPRGPHPPAPSASLTSHPRSPAMDAPTTTCSPATSARPRPFRPRAPLAHSPCSFAPSAELSRPLSRSTHTTSQVPPPLTEDRDHRSVPVAFVASVSSASPLATRDTSRFAPSPSGLPGPRSPECFPCSQSPPPSPRDLSASLSSSKRSWVRACGKQPPRASISLLIVLVVAQFLTGVCLCRCETFPPRSAPSSAPAPA